MSRRSGAAYMIVKYTRQSKNGPQNSAKGAKRRTERPVVLTLTRRCERIKRRAGGIGHLEQSFRKCTFYRIFRSYLRNISDLRCDGLNVM